MTQPRSRKDQEKMLEDGRCMGDYCRQVVGAGHGMQFVEGDGSVTRLCWSCADKRMAEEATVKEEAQ